MVVMQSFRTGMRISLCIMPPARVNTKLSKREGFPVPIHIDQRLFTPPTRRQSLPVRQPMIRDCSTRVFFQTSMQKCSSNFAHFKNVFNTNPNFLQHGYLQHSIARLSDFHGHSSTTACLRRLQSLHPVGG